MTNMTNTKDRICEILRATERPDTFETPIFEFPASFAGIGFTMKAGHLPASLQMMLSFLGVDGVVGMEILKRFSVTICDGKIWV